MAIQGNAFALLDDDDAENLLARLSTASVETPSAVDKPKAKNKKPVPSSHPSSQSFTAAPTQRSFDHEKGRQVSERYNRNGYERQTRPISKGYNNRDGVESHNRNGIEANGGQENGSRQNSRGGVDFKRNNFYKHDERPAADGLRRREGNSNGYYHQKKQETTNGHQKKQETTNGHQQQKEDTNSDGWQIVRRPNGHKQNNVNHWEAPREGIAGGGRERNYVGRREFSNGNGNGIEAKVLEEKQHQDESGEKAVSGGGIVEKSNDNAARDEDESRIRNGGNSRTNRRGYGHGGVGGGNRVGYQRRRNESAAEGEGNGKSSEPTEELVNEKEAQKGSGDVDAGPEWDETASKSSSKGKHDKVPSQREIERMAETELDAKRMTLKEYEKKLEEKRKALEALKTEERRVSLDKEFESMRIIERKNEETNFVKLNSASDKLKKKVVNNKDCNTAPKVKNYLFRPPSGGRGGRYNRNGGASEGAVNDPNAVDKPHIPPPSFEDANQFPALALDGSARPK
ncbi:hypothetical protein C2S51_004721 [Perilla frutescens var. frutescens]|nr:hypothetical protein C2S51_004721 [Perilla frutescens var. frutescens]